MLMKNMFGDQKEGWTKNKKKNEAGPKKVEEVRKEVENKYME